MPSSSVLPQKFVRASSQPMAMPNGSAHAVATIGNAQRQRDRRPFSGREVEHGVPE